MMTAKVQSAGKRTYYFRSHVLGLRLRKVARVIGPLTAKRPLGAKETDVLGLRLRKVARVIGPLNAKRPLGAKETDVLG